MLVIRILVTVSFVLVTFVSGYSFRPTSSFLTRKIIKPVATVSVIIASQFSFQVSDARADLESFSSPIQTISTSSGEEKVSTSVSSSSSEEERVRRKLEKQARASGSEGQVKDDSYLGSLSREKNKQEKLKKAKGERGKDLCEMLGRGC